MFKEARSFFSYSVNDQEAARKFYTEILQLNVEEQKEGLAIHLANGGELFLYPKPNHEPATFTVLNFLVTKVEEAVAALRQKGIVFQQYDLPDLKTDENGIARGNGPTIAWFTDPAGNILSVVQPGT